MRPYTSRMTPPFTMIGSSVAEVEESRHPTYPKGSTIVILAGWIECGIVDPDKKGQLRVRETVVEGFDKMPYAFMGLFSGD